MRKLATIRSIANLRPIEGADRIETATIDGWQVVVEKDRYKEGENIIYCEIDSFLPIRPQYEFLRKSSYKKLRDGQEGFRLRTVKLRGQVSQGLVLKIEEQPELDGLSLEYMLDVSELLGIVKYDPPLPAELLGYAKGNFPSFIPKTDEERIQNLADQVGEYKELYFYITEKVDGTSTTFYHKDGEFGACFRTYELLDSPDSVEWQYAKKLRLPEKMATLGKNFAVQGELIGAKLYGHKNKYKLPAPKVMLFSLYLIDEYRYGTYTELCEVAEALGMETVPVHATSRKFVSIDDALQLASGKSLIADIEREGHVWRAFKGTEMISFKVISNSFLLKEE